MGVVNAIFVDPEGNVRSGWRIGVFLIITLILGVFLVVPLGLFGLLTDTVQRLVSVCAVLGGSLVTLRVFHRKPLQAIGLSIHHAAVREFGFGCLLAAAMQAVLFSIGWVAGSISIEALNIPAQRSLAILVDAGFFFLLGAAFEEVLFRGYIFQALMQWISFLPAMMVMALCFSLAHLRNPNAGTLGFINIALASVWFSVAYFKTRGLWLPIGLHFGWNFAQTTLFGLPTSGITFADKSLVETAASGPAWLTGGAFGPEGGLLATIALLSCTWYIWQSKRITAVPGIVTLDSADEPRADRFVYTVEATQREKR
jgi:membrane protease YdiL (CAAX protease family)